jgi:2-hydroxy-6-oxonona-2,4-dienedioate hydrolase
VDEQRYREAERALWASVDVEPTERWCQLGRLGTTVRLQEMGSGPPVLFIHGASNAGTSWAALASRLDGFHCILLDRPGCGLSPPRRERLSDMATLGTFAEELAVDVLDALELPAVHVVATSFGGYFGLRAAAAHPERITKLVELGWTFGAAIESTPLVMRVAMQPFLGRLLTKVTPSERMVRSLLKQVGLRQAVETGRFGDVEIAWYLSLLRDTTTMRNEIDSTPRVVTMRGFNDETLLPASVLARVRSPVLFLWGGQDPMGGAEVARAFVEQLPDAELELLPGAGHAPWIDEPEHVADRVDRFLRA